MKIGDKVEYSNKVIKSSNHYNINGIVGIIVHSSYSENPDDNLYRVKWQDDRECKYWEYELKLYSHYNNLLDELNKLETKFKT